MSQFPFIARPVLSITLVFLLATPSAVLAQQTPAPVADDRSARLKIFVLEGDKAINRIPTGSSTSPVIEVRNEDDVPVEGADVRFELPASGPGGFFPQQQLAFTARTNLQGQAMAPMTINTIPGMFEIKVNATFGNRTGGTIITQTNTLETSEQATIIKKRHHWYTDWRVLAIAGGSAAAAVVIVLATRGSSPTTIAITPGVPTFGGPK